MKKNPQKKRIAKPRKCPECERNKRLALDESRLTAMWHQHYEDLADSFFRPICMKLCLSERISFKDACAEVIKTLEQDWNQEVVEETDQETDLVQAVNRVAAVIEKYVNLCTDPGKLVVHELTAEEMDTDLVTIPPEAPKP